MATNRSVNDLVDVLGRFGLSINFTAPVIFELAEDASRARKLTELSQCLRLAARMGIHVDKHGCLLGFRQFVLHSRGALGQRSENPRADPAGLVLNRSVHRAIVLRIIVLRDSE